MTGSDDQLAIDFEDAHYGRGTRYMSLDDARNLLAYATARDYAFQTMEAFEVVDDSHVLTLEFSILGLTNIERSAVNALDLRSVAQQCLDGASAQPNPFIFRIWVDTVEGILSRPPRRGRLDKT